MYVKSCFLSKEIKDNELMELVTSYKKSNRRKPILKEETDDGYFIEFNNQTKITNHNCVIGDFLIFKKLYRGISLKYKVEIDYKETNPNQYDQFSQLFPEVHKYLNERNKQYLNLNILSDFNLNIDNAGVSRKLKKLKESYNLIESKAKNGELSSLIFCCLIIFFHRGEDLEKPELDIQVDNYYPGFFKYIDLPIESERLISSKCFNNIDEYSHLSVGSDSISFLDNNTVLKASNPRIYLKRPEIRYLNCFQKYIHKVKEL